MGIGIFRGNNEFGFFINYWLNCLILYRNPPDVCKQTAKLRNQQARNKSDQSSLLLLAANTQEHVVQRGLAQTPEQQDLLLLERGNMAKEFLQIHLLLGNGERRDARALVHKLQITADVRLHVLHHVGNGIIQLHREDQTATEFVLQVDLTANTAQSLVGEDGNTRAEGICLLHGVGGEQDGHFGLDGLDGIPDGHARFQIETGLAMK